LVQVNAELPGAFEELFDPADYKGWYGGRGSAKTWSIATALIIVGAWAPKRILCCREIQLSIKPSSKAILDDQINNLG
jgi:phage terminase large subunit